VSKKSSAVDLAFCFIAAFAVRLYAAVQCEALPDFSDMAAYNAAALAKGIPTSLPPGYPLFLRLIYTIFGAYNYRAVFIIQGLLGAVTVGLIYWIARRISNRRAAVLAACAAAVYPNFIAYGLTTMAGTIALFFVALLSLALVAPMNERRRSILAAVIIFIGAAFRPVMLFFAPGVFASLKKRLAFAVALAVVLVPLISVALFSGSEVRRAARGFYKTYNPSSTGRSYIDMSSTELGRDDLPAAAYLKGSLEFIRNNKWRTLDIIYNKTSIVLSRGWDSFVLSPVLGGEKNVRRPVAYIMTYAYIPIMLLGFMGMIRRYNEKNRFLALMTLSYLSIFLLVLIFKVRYRLLVEPLLIIYAAIFVEHSFKALSVPRFGAWFKRLLAPREIEPEHGADASAERTDDGTRSWKRFIPLRTCRDWDILLVILFAALAIRVYLALSYEAQLYSPDMVRYNRLAITGGFGTGTPPLYPLFLRATYAVFGKGNFQAVFLIQGILNALVIPLMYTIVARLCNRRAGVIAAAITAVYPDFIVYNVSLLADSLGVFLVVLLMATGVAHLRSRSKALISAGLVAAGILMKPVLVCLVPGVLVTAKRWRLFLLVLLLLLVPYTVRNVMRHQKIQPVYDPAVYGLTVQSYTNSRAPWITIDTIYKNSSALLTRGWKLTDESKSDSMKRNSTYAAMYGYTIVMMLGLIGLIRFYKREQREAVLPVLLYVLALILFSQFKLRYRVPIEPVFIAYASILLGGRHCK
jgi:4-amino-4-deoxy-L-arabinose transferase-like glycosyltransferase